jgi:multiple sugar transport system permease protein
VLKIKKRKLNKDTLWAIIFLLPSLIGFLIFYIIPFIGSIYYSLLDNPVNAEFVGLINYIDLIQNEVFKKASINTARFTFIAVPLNIIISLGLALLLNSNIRGKSLFRTLFVTPLVVPVASVVFIWQSTFDINGFINGMLVNLGQAPVDWMKTEYARYVAIIVFLWKNVGYSIVIMLAGLQGIPVEYYESASIDGCGEVKKFFKITLIYLTPTLFFTFIMAIINSFKVFREIYLLAGEYPHDSIYMLQHYMNNMFRNLDYGKLTSAAVIMAAVITVLVLTLFKAERKISGSLR